MRNTISVTATELVHTLNNRPRPPAISIAMIAVRKNLGIGKPMEARIVDDCRKAKIFPAPDATKKNAIRQRAIVAISIPVPFATAQRR
jgi:hypothetical protein